MKVEYIDHMGTDLTVVNAARVSFAKESKELNENDKNLIRFLARGMSTKNFDAFFDEVFFAAEKISMTSDHLEELRDLLWQWRRTPTHWAPFAHPQISLRVKMPVFIARQLVKHQVGFVWSEVSRRYVTDDPEFFTPLAWHSKPENRKQGSGYVLNTSDSTYINKHVEEAQKLAFDTYKWLLDHMEVAPEQARMILPQSMYTEVVITGSLYAWANMYNQRSDSHAQKEIQDLAGMVREKVEPLFPVSWKALTEVV